MAKKTKTAKTEQTVVNLEISKVDVVEINASVAIISASEDEHKKTWLSVDREAIAALVEKQAFLQSLHKKFSPKLYEGTSLGGKDDFQKYLRKALNTIQAMEFNGETGIKAFYLFTLETKPTSVTSFLSKWQRRDRPETEAEVSEPEETEQDNPADLDLASEVQILIERHQISLAELVEFIEDHMTISHDVEALKTA